MGVIDLGVQDVSDAAYDDLSGAGLHVACRRDAVTETLNEKLAVGVKHDFDNTRIVECCTDRVTQCFLKLSD